MRKHNIDMLSVPHMLLALLLIWVLAISSFAAGKLDFTRNLKNFGDLDHDGSIDFAAIRNLPDKTSELVAFETDPEGVITENWRFLLPDNLVGEWVDYIISDLNLNGKPEIIAVTKVISASANQSVPWVYGFEWSDNGFPFVPTFQWGWNPEQGLFSRPSQIESGDLDRDGLSEVVIILSSPQPNLLVLEFNGELSAPNIEIEHMGLPGSIASVPAPCILAIADVDDDGVDDITLYQKQGNKLRLTQISATGEDSYRVSHEAILPLPSKSLAVINPEAIAFADLEHRGETQAYIGSTNGDVYTYNFNTVSSQSDLRSESTPREARLWQKFPEAVHQLTFSDNDNDGAYELLIRTGENVFYLEQNGNGSATFADFNSLISEEVVYAQNALPVSGGLVISRNGQAMVFPSVSGSEEALTPPEYDQNGKPADVAEESSLVTEPGTPAPQLVTISEEDQSVAMHREPEKQKRDYRRPKEADIILHVGEAFTHVIPRKEEIDPGQASMHFKTYPVGMRLGQDFTLRWTPQINQLGYHEVSYVFGYIIDTSFTIYVNDAPRIYSTPSVLAQTGQQYLYQLQLEDMNEEQYVSFELISAPAGMQIDNEGLLRWLPSDTQLDSQYVSVGISDGFERVTQKFTLYVNSPPVIIEKPAPVAFVSEPYVGQLSIQDKNKNNTARVIPVRTPNNLIMESSGRITWTPERGQTGFHDIIFELTDDMTTVLDSFTLFANTSPVITSKYDEHVPVAKPWHYNVEVNDPNKNQDISYLLSESSIPNLSISRRGHITWTPSEADLGRQTFTISVSDGLRDDLQKVTLYVNSAPVIGTITDTLAFIARPYTTTVPVTDLNKDEILNYTFLSAPQGMRISQAGQISWTPTKVQKGWNEVFIKVSDKYSSDTYKFAVYANAPPLIVSQADSMAVAGQEYIYEIKALDLNTEQELIYEVFDAPEGMTLVGSSTVTWTPTFAQINKAQFKVSVTDGYNTNVQTVDLFVNALPEITSVPTAVVLTNREYRYKLEARDLNGDGISFSKVLLPSGAEMDEEAGTIFWVPDASNEGTNDFIIEVKDTRNMSSMHEFQVHVFNDPKTPIRQMGAFLITLAGIGAMFIIKFLY